MTGERIRWVSCFDRSSDVGRMTTWHGQTTRIVIVGLPPGFANSCPLSFELPPGATTHPYPEHADIGVVFTVFVKEKP